MLLAAILAACTAPDPVDRQDPGPAPVGPEPTVPPIVQQHTGDSGTPPTDTGTPVTYSCESPFLGPFTVQASSLIQTEEDFDFEIDGLLAMQDANNLVGVTRTGQMTLIASNIGFDVAGIRSLPTGDILVTQQDLARVSRVDVATGNTVNVVSGVGFPNGLEVGLTDGLAYVSDYAENGRVLSFDPYPGPGGAVPTVVLEITYPNGLALSPDEQTLYVATSTRNFGGDGKLAAIDRDPKTGAWIPEPRLVFETDELLDAIAVDVCGNVYVTGYDTGRVTRIRPDGTIDPIVDLPNAGWEGYCAARFGPGIGDWTRTTLYVSNRAELHAIEIGIEGRHVLAPEQ